MNWNRKELNQVLTEYDAVADDVLSADYSSFDSKLKRLVHLLKNHPYLLYVNDTALPSVEFSRWYENACKSVKGMVGSGTLDWPVDRKEHLSMRLRLLEYMAQGNVDAPNLCSKFMYAGNQFDDCVSKVNEQIIESFVRDYRLLVEDIASQIISDEVENTSVIALHWFQKIKIWADNHINLLTFFAFIIAGVWALFIYINTNEIDDYEIYQKIQSAKNDNFTLEIELNESEELLKLKKQQINKRESQIATADRTIKTLKDAQEASSDDSIRLEQQLLISYDGKNKLIEETNRLKNEKSELFSKTQLIRFKISQNKDFIRKFSNE